MTSIVLRPLPSPTGGDVEVVQLVVVAPPEALDGFDQLEVFRSLSTSQGPYEPLTDRTWKGAQARADWVGHGLSAPTWIPGLSGKTLELVVAHSRLVQITFTGGEPITPADAAQQIIDQGHGLLLAYSNSHGELVVETAAPGAAASLNVIASEAAHLLGLPLGVQQGRDMRPDINPHDPMLVFTDPFGSRDAFYRTRFRNRSTGAVSAYSLPYSVASQGVGLSPSSLVVGELQLVSGDGRPVVGRTVSLKSEFNGTVVEGAVVAGSDLTGATNHDGRVEFVLVRGQRYTLAISGTNLVRDITAPVDPAVNRFSLVSAEAGNQDDYFKVVVPNIPTMERRSH